LSNKVAIATGIAIAAVIINPTIAPTMSINLLAMLVCEG
jgi:hypothetical protein